MAYVVCRMRGKTNIVLLNLDLDLLTTSGMWFSDGNIASKYSHLQTDLSHLTELDWETIRNWAGENGFTQWKRKTKKAAEVLIPRIVPQSKILRIAVCDASVKDKIVRDLHIPEEKIVVAPEQYHDVIQ